MTYTACTASCRLQPFIHEAVDSAADSPVLAGSSTGLPSTAQVGECAPGRPLLGTCPDTLECPPSCSCTVHTWTSTAARRGFKSERLDSCSVASECCVAKSHGRTHAYPPTCAPSHLHTRAPQSPLAGLWPICYVLFDETIFRVMLNSLILPVVCHIICLQRLSGMIPSVLIQRFQTFKLVNQGIMTTDTRCCGVHLV